MLQFNISNHPVITSLTRKVEVTELNYDKSKTQIMIEIRVDHFQGEVEIGDFKKNFPLIANNSKMVLIDGEEVPDFNYLVQAIQSDVPIKSLIGGIIEQRDLDGTINAHCKYQIQDLNQGETVI